MVKKIASKKPAVKTPVSSRQIRKRLFREISIDASKSADAQLEELSRNVKEARLESRAGQVAFAGRGVDGTTRVEFDMDGIGWISDWPEWAFAQAQVALVNNLRLWVVSNGLPYGFNLHQVFLLQRNG